MTVALVAVSAGVSSALAVLVLVALARRLRARLRAEESDARELAAPHLVPLSDEHARAIAHAISEKRRRGGAPIALALACLSLVGCAPAWQTGAALVASAHVAVTGYQRYTHDSRRSILAASGCRDAAACEAALAPFEAKQAPALACLSALTPLVEGAALAAEAHDVKAAAAVVPELGARLPACVVEIQRAKR